MSAVDPGAQAPAPEPTQAAQEPAPSGPDLSPVFDRLDQLAGGLGQLTEQFQGFAQQQAPQPEAEQDWWSSLYEDPAQQQQQEPQFDPYTGQPLQTQQAQQQQQALNPQALQQAVQQAIQQGISPYAAQVQQMQRQQALTDLTTRIPQLKEPEVAQRTQELLAQQIAHLPQQVQEALVWDPNFIETVFKAAEAEKLAGAQEPAGEPTPQLETAGGAHPGGTGEEQNIVHQAYANRPGVPKGFL